MTETPRETRVLGAVVSLVDSLLDDFDVVDLLTELTERCTQLLDVDSAGLLLADPLEQLRVFAATSEETRELELFQLQADEGPCMDCYSSGQPVSVADLRAEADLGDVHEEAPRLPAVGVPADLADIDEARPAVGFGLDIGDGDRLTAGIAVHTRSLVGL